MLGLCFAVKFSAMHKPFFTFYLLLFTFYFSPVFALPLQEPIPGLYQCFSSQTDPFDVNALSIGATLEFLNAQSYRFTTDSATEEGRASTSIFESSDDGVDALFQSGSALALQPNNSSAAYEGGFLVDYLGEAYIIIKNNNSFWLRCQSAGADVAASLEAARNQTASTANEPGDEPVATPTSSETLQPLQTFQPGGYTCIYTYDTTHGASGDYPSYYPDDDPTGFYVLMFANGTTLTLGQDDILRSEYSTGTYTFDAAQSKLNLQGGSLGGLGMSYGTNAEGKTALYSSQTAYALDDEGNQLDIQYIATRTCDYDNPVPAELSTGFPDSTPKIDLNNIVVTASKYDATIDLELEPIVDTYYCYPSFGALEIGEGYPRYLREFVLEILPNKRYKLDGQEGEYRTGVEETYLQWLSGPLNPTGDIVEDENDYGLPHAATVDVDDWGSSITYTEAPKDDKTVRIDCFQAGAREQKALLDFAVQQPVVGVYGCLPSGDNPQMVGLELLPNNRYKFDNQEGSYQTFTDESSTDILWESGPLRDETRYSVEDETGLRTLEFSFTEVHGIIPVGISTETTMVCQTVTKANLIPKYSITPAPPLSAGSGGLNGFYAKANYENDSIENVSSSATWSYYHFLPDGRVYEDGYITGDECTKTYPSGRPVCKTYSLQGNVLTFNDGASVAVSQGDNGGIILDGVLYENKGLEGAQTLSGTYEYTQTSSTPIYLTVMGNGSSSSFTSEYTFSPDGSYSFSSNSSSTFFAGGNFGGAGVFGQNSSSESDSGTYTLNGNVLLLQSDAGYSKQCAFFFPVTGDTTRVNICGTDYGPPSGE